MVDGLFDRGAQNGCLVAVFREGSSKTMRWCTVCERVAQNDGLVHRLLRCVFKNDALVYCFAIPCEKLFWMPCGSLFEKAGERIDSDMLDHSEAW